MRPVKISTLSFNYFNLPLWAGQHRGIFAYEELDVEI